MTNYFIYARKSTDVEDKQVRSIEDQLAELREFARRDGLKIKEELVVGPVSGVRSPAFRLDFQVHA